MKYEHFAAGFFQQLASPLDAWCGDAEHGGRDQWAIFGRVGDRTKSERKRKGQALSRCEISSRLDPPTSERTRLEVAQPSDSPVMQSTLARLAGKYVELASGEWGSRYRSMTTSAFLPVTLGSPPL